MSTNPLEPNFTPYFCKNSLNWRLDSIPHAVGVTLKDKDKKRIALCSTQIYNYARLFTLETIALRGQWRAKSKTEAVIHYAQEDKVITDIKKQMKCLYRPFPNESEQTFLVRQQRLFETAGGILDVIEEGWRVGSQEQNKQNLNDEELALLLHKIFWEPVLKLSKEATERKVSLKEFQDLVDKLGSPESISSALDNNIIPALKDTQIVETLERVARDSNVYANEVEARIKEHYPEASREIVCRIYMLLGNMIPSDHESFFKPEFAALEADIQIRQPIGDRYLYMHRFSVAPLLFLICQKMKEKSEHIFLEYPATDQEPCLPPRMLGIRLEKFVDEFLDEIHQSIYGNFKVHEAKAEGKLDRIAQGLAFLHSLYGGEFQNSKWYSDPTLAPFFKRLVHSQERFQFEHYKTELLPLFPGLIWNAFHNHLDKYNLEKVKQDPKHKTLKLNPHETYVELTKNIIPLVASENKKIPVESITTALMPKHFLETEEAAQLYFLEALGSLGSQADLLNLTNQIYSNTQYKNSRNQWVTVKDSYKARFQALDTQTEKVIEAPSVVNVLDLSTTKEGLSSIQTAADAVQAIASAITFIVSPAPEKKSEDLQTQAGSKEPSLISGASSGIPTDAKKVGAALGNLKTQFNQQAKQALMALIDQDTRIRDDVREAIKNTQSIWKALDESPNYVDQKHIQAIHQHAVKISAVQSLQEGLAQFKTELNREVEQQTVVVNDNFIRRRFNNFFTLAKTAKNTLTKQEQALFQRDCEAITRTALIKQEIRKETSLNQITGYFIENALLKALGKGSIDDPITREIRNKAELDILKTMLQGEGLEPGSIAKMQDSVNHQKLEARLVSAGYIDELERSKIVAVIQELSHIHSLILEKAAWHKDSVRNLPLQLPQNVRDFLLETKANMVERTVESLITKIVTEKASIIKNAIPSRTEPQLRHLIENLLESTVIKVESGAAFEAIDKIIAKDMAFYNKWGSKIKQRLIQGQYNNNEIHGKGVCFGLSVRWVVSRTNNPKVKESYKITMKDRFKQTMCSLSVALREALSSSETDTHIATWFPDNLKKEAGIKEVKKVFSITGSGIMKGIREEFDKHLKKDAGPLLIAMTGKGTGHAIGIDFSEVKGANCNADPNVGEAYLDSREEFLDYYEDLIRTHYEDYTDFYGFKLIPK